MLFENPGGASGSDAEITTIPISPKNTDAEEDIKRRLIGRNAEVKEKR